MAKRKIENPNLALVVFRCVRCSSPCTTYIITSGPYSEENIKEHPFEPKCDCGWTLPMKGAEAVHILRAEWNFEMYYAPRNFGIASLESEEGDQPQTKS